ncbi:MAG: hypothetical protein JKY47_04245, partial [Thalassospira sp.]|nr:hypothetical protein [Thalassospira sp.]
VFAVFAPQRFIALALEVFFDFLENINHENRSNPIKRKRATCPLVRINSGKDLTRQYARGQVRCTSGAANIAIKSRNAVFHAQNCHPSRCF